MGLNRKWKIILGIVFCLVFVSIIWSYQSFLITKKVTKSSKKMQEAADKFFNNQFPVDSLKVDSLFNYAK